MDLTAKNVKNALSTFVPKLKNLIRSNTKFSNKFKYEKRTKLDIFVLKYALNFSESITEWEIANLFPITQKMKVPSSKVLRRKFFLQFNHLNVFYTI